MGKGKLSKFEELKTFSNVFQPPIDEVFGKDYKLKGKWAGEHFKNDHPIVLELGCGKGEYTIGLAELFPGKNFIGIDIKGARIWKGAKLAYREKIPNVAFIRTRIEFINSFFGENEVDEVWLTFPDPQLKQRRIKKRLTAASFLNSYREFLKDRGLIHLKTDNAVLYQYTLELAEQNELPLLYATEDLYGSGQEDVVYGIRTYYEEQFIEKGMKIHYLKFELPHSKIISDKDANKDFFSRVYEVARLIPAGRVTSYGAIARYIGSPQAARMVGWAMNNSHAQDKYVPAHRVINRNGVLSGKHHFGGPHVMRELLESEGVEVKEDCVINFQTLFWDPNAELV